MKTYSERAKSIENKIAAGKVRRKNTRIAAITCTALAVLVIGLVLFIPYDTSAPDVSMYADSPYYSLIQRINEATYQKPRFKNNFEMLAAGLVRITVDSVSSDKGNMMPGSAEIANNGNALSYQEVTDNQVAGVIEGDLFKRSDRYLYYMHQNKLEIYTIAGEDSAMIGSFSLGTEDTATLPVYGDAEMFLSQDCTTVTLVYPCMGTNNKTAYVCVLNLDVTDPANIQKCGHVLITGSQNTARMVDGKLMLLSDFYINNKDFSDESTFLPQIGKEGDMQSVAAENIVAPEKLSNTHYTVVTLIDAKTLEVHDTAAFLSYSDVVHVSQNHIFATRSFQEGRENRRMTEISCIGYTTAALTVKGTVSVTGSVKNQYSLDEHEGILRLVTSTSEIQEALDNEIVSASNRRNASLYCVDLEDFSIAAKVENFAPWGEQAESVRFDGDVAYVCTAEVITLTDPVYFFDLSDLENITWKDTGTIAGYSSSLVDFGEEYLLGIGFNERQELKIEVYAETEAAVESLCRFELAATFSQDYKAYFIDREGGYVGLAVYNHENGNTEYLLLKFDGYRLHTLVQTPVTADISRLRSTMIDGYLYILADEFAVTKVY